MGLSPKHCQWHLSNSNWQAQTHQVETVCCFLILLNLQTTVWCTFLFTHLCFTNNIRWRRTTVQENKILYIFQFMVPCLHFWGKYPPFCVFQHGLQPKSLSLWYQVYFWATGPPNKSCYTFCWNTSCFICITNFYHLVSHQPLMPTITH